MELDVKYAPLSMTKVSEEYLHNGFNYILPIYSKSSNETIASRLWFLGSGREDCMGVSGYECIYPDQIEWFLKESRAIPDTDKNKKKGMAFFHMPI